MNKYLKIAIISATVGLTGAQAMARDNASAPTPLNLMTVRTAGAGLVTESAPVAPKNGAVIPLDLLTVATPGAGIVTESSPARSGGHH